jgi:uncharacterized protein YjbI with pentapeptide repeats
MTYDELDLVLDLHRQWLAGQDGERANLHDADLSGADLRGADLRLAYLNHADLSGADLRCAYLLGADLHGSNLRGVRTNWFARMTARGARNLTDEQRARLGMQPARAENAGRGRARSATQLARRLAR